MTPSVQRKAAMVSDTFNLQYCWKQAIRLMTIVAIVAFCLVASVSAQSESCRFCKPRQYVAFNGAFCSSGHFRMYIGGVLVASGAAACDGASYVRSNSVIAGLIVDVTYQLQVINACSSHINFYDIPEGYYLEVDGKERRTIDKAGVGLGDGDGIWNVTLRRKCNCGNGNGGESAGPKMGSIMWDVGLGKLSDGRGAGSLSIHSETLQAFHYAPTSLIYFTPGYTNEVDVIRNPVDTALRQVKSPEILADIVVINSDKYEIRFYRNADVGPKDQNGLYTFSNQPFVTWRVENPHPGFVDQLQISKIQGAATQSSLYTFNSGTNTWTLTTGNGERTETKVITTDAGTGDKTETYTVTNGSGQLISKVSRTYHQFTWPKQELIRQVVDPDGAALTTTYAYYENSSEAGRYMRLKSVTNSDGSWEQYDYDATGARTLVLRPWKDQPLATATEANSYAIRTTYSNYDGIETTLDAKFISSVEDKVLGVTVKKTTYSRAGTTVNGQPAVIETETNYSASAAGLATITTRYHSTAADFFVNRTASIQFPDGRKDTYVYEKGNYVANPDPSLSTFTPDANGAAERETIIHGTTAAVDGVPFKTTKETTTRDQFGHAVLREAYVYNGSGYDRISWSVMDYDDRGHLTQTRRSNGTVSSSTWDGDLMTADIDENGVQTTYSYDALNRVATRTRKGVVAAGSFPAQVDVVTTFTYDAEGRIKSETTSASGLTLSRSRTYDVAGRAKTDTDTAGLLTTYLYTNGGRTETLTLPGGATRASDRYLDAQMKTVLGSSVVAQFFDYGVNVDGTRFTQEYTGSAGSSSPRWTKTTSDWLGRTIQLERPSFISGTNVIQSSSYNSIGQLASESVTAGGNKLFADKLYEYDVLGNQLRSGSDIDNNGSLTLASTDRIQEREQVFQQSGSDWYRVTTDKTYLVAGNSTPTTLSIRSERLNNFAVNGSEKTVADLTTTDVAGNQTRVTTLVDRDGKKVTNRTDSPDSAIDALTITYNGLLQSASPSIPVPATTYTYDALGRLLTENDPAVGTNAKTYDAATGQLLTESHGSQTTTYEYYPLPHSSAGKVKSRTNAAGKKVYFNYNSREEMVQTWGDATYPVEYVYDAYGQRTEMHTFRGGSNWQGSSWPAATLGVVDISRWKYHEPTGLITAKQDAVMKEVLYSYDTAGRVANRKWARLSGGNPVQTTYAYDPQSGQLSGITYSDGTQAVSFNYDRGGRRSSITDAAGSHTLTRNAAGQLLSDAVTGGVLDGANVSVTYDSLLRRDSLQATRNAVTLTSQTYAYDTFSRLNTVTSGAQTATYAYNPTTSQLNTTTFTSGAQIVRSFDSLGRLETIATVTPAQGTVASYVYTYNNLDQRTRVTREDNSYWSYVYNDRGELTSGKKYWSDNSPVAGQQTEYSFDSIGNRTSAKAGGDGQGLNLRQSAYTANSVNQYQQRTVPGALDILGTADQAANVTVNDQPAYRRGDYFYKELAVDNTLAPAYPQVKAVGVRGGVGGSGEDAVTQINGQIYVPKNIEAYTYDNDGNVITDGRWTYTWDAENRLTAVQAIATAPVASRRRLEFVYDYMGRRIQKKVFVWNAGAGNYQLQSTTKFVYDGWDLVAELDANNVLTRGYVRGGGELLLINDGGQILQVGYDGTHNVAVLVKTGNGTVVASYDYDPFGQSVKALNEDANQNPFRFSDQYTDTETGFVYYGYRYYNPQIGGWLTRDPLQEQGGVNLRQFVFNDPLSTLDVLGLGSYRLFGNVGPHPPFDKGSGQHGAQKPTMDDLAGFMAWNNIASAAEWVYPDAAKHMRHYLLNSGKTLEVDVRKMIKDSERPRWYYYNEINDAMSSAEEAADLNPQLKRMRLAGNWNLGENGKSDEGGNWFYAVGGYRAAGYAEVDVLDDCKFNMNFSYYFADKYNWDRGKHVKILGYTVSDATLGRLHEVGLAHEYEMTGTAGRNVYWERGQRFNSDGEINPWGGRR